MHPVPALLCALRFLLPLATCGWATTVPSPLWSKPDELVHLYTFNPWKTIHLQIHPNGRIDGSLSQTVYSAVLIKAVRAGYVTIVGAKSRRYLCMHRNGRLVGSRSFRKEDCIFKHTLLENHYDVYESVKHNLLVSLGYIKKRFVPGWDLPPFSQFITRENEIPLSHINPSGPQAEDTRDDNDIVPCLGINTGGIREENIGEAGIDPCLIG